MGTWRVDSDLLARARFAVSQKAEVVCALEALVVPSDPAARAFHGAHHVAFEAMLDERPVRRDLIFNSFRPRRGDQPGWIAHYLAALIFRGYAKCRLPGGQGSAGPRGADRRRGEAWAPGG